MKINLFVKEIENSYTFDFDKESLTFLQPKCSSRAKLIPYTTLELDCIPNKDTTIVGHKIISINITSNNEADVVLDTPNNTEVNLYYKDKFESIDVPSLLTKRYAKELYNLVTSKPINWCTIAQNIHQSQYKDYDATGEHARQLDSIRYAMASFLPVIGDEVFSRLGDNITNVYRNEVILAMTLRCGIPLTITRVSLLKYKLARSILGRYMIFRLGL